MWNTMKTLFEKLFVHFDFIAHPAGGRSGKKEGSTKRKASKSSSQPTLSPDSFYMRSPSAKKQDNLRRTPAP